MAEGLINHIGGETFNAVSAGSFPAGYVHPHSLLTLRRHGIVVINPRSKSWDEFAKQNFDFVITVCDEAAKEVCPTFVGTCKKLHWSTPDPAKVEGSDAEIEAAFEAAYQTLKARIQAELL